MTREEADALDKFARAVQSALHNLLPDPKMIDSTARECLQRVVDTREDLSLAIAFETDSGRRS